MYWRAPAVSAAVILLSFFASSPALATAPMTISSVQGTGASTPFAGQVVTVQGVVTCDLSATIGGLFIQSPGSSAHDKGSDGIFVDLTSVTTAATADAVATGDLVSVTGVAREKSGETEIVAQSVSLVTANVGVPAAAALPSNITGAQREKYEDMLVVPTGKYYFERTVAARGEVSVSAATSTASAKSVLFIDDGYSARESTQPFLLADTVIKKGDTLVAPAKAMALGQGSEGYRLEPNTPITTSSDSSLKPKFHAVSPRIGSAISVKP